MERESYYLGGGRGEENMVVYKDNFVCVKSLKYNFYHVNYIVDSVFNYCTSKDQFLLP